MVKIDSKNDTLFLLFEGELLLYEINKYQTLIESIDYTKFEKIVFELKNLIFIDTAWAIYITTLYNTLDSKSLCVSMNNISDQIRNTLDLVKNNKLEW